MTISEWTVMDESDPEYAAISHALDLLAAADNGSLSAAKALLALAAHDAETQT
jgi:hypothetical protein